MEQIGRQRSILESVLLLSRADAGKLEISREQVNLSELLETWVEDASFLAEPREISVRSEIQPDLWIEGDAVMLQQVAHNLFSNAVRYNRDGGEIICRLTSNGQQVEWKVTNTGGQIQPEDRKQIFERFYHGNGNGGEMGVGLGLSLVREIVQAHGGTVKLLESNDEATSFLVEL